MIYYKDSAPQTMCTTKNMNIVHHKHYEYCAPQTLWILCTTKNGHHKNVHQIMNNVHQIMNNVHQIMNNVHQMDYE